MPGTALAEAIETGVDALLLARLRVGSRRCARHTTSYVAPRRDFLSNRLVAARRRMNMGPENSGRETAVLPGGGPLGPRTVISEA